MQPECSQIVARSQQGCSQNEARMLPECIRNIVRMQSECSQNVVRMYSECSQNVVRMQSECSQNVAKMQPEFGQKVVRMQSECSQNVIRMQSECSQPECCQKKSDYSQNVVNGSHWQPMAVIGGRLRSILGLFSSSELYVGRVGWDGMRWDGWLSQVVGSLREPSVLIRGRVVLGFENLFSIHMSQSLTANSYSNSYSDDIDILQKKLVQNAHFCLKKPQHHFILAKLLQCESTHCAL